MLKRLKKVKMILLVCLSVIGLSGCANAPTPTNDYCLIDQRIIPTNEEIDKAIDAELIPLLMRIDEHDTRYEDVCTK